LRERRVVRAAADHRRVARQAALSLHGKRHPQRLPAGARAAVFAAGLEARFVNEPQKRIWANFQHGTTNYCSISWYRLPDREALAQYSQPFHEDLPHTILIAPGMAAREAHATLPRC
jgi:hypothetical protein